MLIAGSMCEQSAVADVMNSFAETHLGETETARKDGIKVIKEYLEEFPYLNAQSDDYSILIFLRRCKFNTEQTKEKIRNYYEMRGKIPEWFTNRDPNLPEILDLLNVGVFVPITQEKPGPLVVIIRIAAHDPSKNNQNDVFKTGKMILDLALKEYESASVYGVYAIFDMLNVSYSHAKQLTPSMIKKAVFAWQNYNCRPQNLEFVNAPVYINVVLNIFKNFMSDKMKARVHVHWSGFDDLHKLVPKEQLPVEYGGTNKTLNDFIDHWRTKALENTDWFKSGERYRANLEQKD